MIDAYFQKIVETLAQTKVAEDNKMQEAAKQIATTIAAGGIVQLFGCGHSHMLAEEVFYRAGGLVPVKPILHEPLMLHEGAMRSSETERRGDYAPVVMGDQDIQKNDVLFVFSTSGRNPVPIDVAKMAKGKGAYVIGVTSVTYSMSQPSRHQSGKRLVDVVDLVIDNHVPIGDAVLTYEGVAVPFAPISSVTGTTIINAVFAEVIKLLALQGIEPPVFLSGNIDGADAHNKALIEKYAKRIPLLS